MRVLRVHFGASFLALSLILAAQVGAEAEAGRTDDAGATDPKATPDLFSFERTDTGILARSASDDQAGALTALALEEELRSERVRSQPAEVLAGEPTHIIGLYEWATQLDRDRVFKFIDSLGGSVVSTSPGTGSGSFLFAKLTNNAASRIQSDASVNYVEENVFFRLESRDVRETVPWNVDRADQAQLPLDGKFFFDASGAGIPVYVVDTGISYRYPTLLYWYYLTADFVWLGEDCNGHGTHVAGTIVDEDYGIAPGALLIPVKASLGCNAGFSTAALISGLGVIARDRDEEFGVGAPAVVNLSLGGEVTASSAALDAEVQSLIQQGFTVVVAAGNSSQDACGFSPARVSRAITVGASNQFDQRAAFSNHGPCVDIFAPGVDVESIYSLFLDSLFPRVVTRSGTSMAAPLVAGAAAIVLERCPRATPEEVKASLLNAASASLTSLLDSPNRLLYLRPHTGFCDVPAVSTFPADIRWLADRGITTGCNPPFQDLFCPKRPVTRGQMAAFLGRTLQLPPAPSAGFTDVPRGSTFEGDINRLAAAGITTGCGPNRYCPNDPVTRQQMAAFLVRAFGLPPAGSAGFTDVPPGSTFEGDINRLAAAGITTGCGPSSFCPTNPVTREQMAAFLRRAAS